MAFQQSFFDGKSFHQTQGNLNSKPFQELFHYFKTFNNFLMIFIEKFLINDHVLKDFILHNDLLKSCPLIFSNRIVAYQISRAKNFTVPIPLSVMKNDDTDSFPTVITIIKDLFGSRTCFYLLLF
jgi:hypothetical protein